MRQADVSARPCATWAVGAVPGGAIRRTVRTTRIPAPRLARQDGSSVLQLPDNVQPLVQAATANSTSRFRGWLRDGHLRVVLGIGDAIAVLVGYYLVILWVSPVRLSSWLELVVQMVAVTSVGLLAIRSQGLWVDRMISVRAIELSRLAARNRPARSRDDRARPRHQAVLPRRGDLPRVRHRVRRARSPGDRSTAPGWPASARKATSSVVSSSSAPTGEPCS